MSLSDPRSLVAVDPGKSACGVALFINERFRAGAYLKAEETFDLGIAVESWVRQHQKRFTLPDTVDVLVVEGQQIYGAVSYANPNDLLPLAYLAGAVFARVPAHARRMPLPRQWKGSLKKELFTRRILSSMRADERIVLEEVDCPKSKLHNVLDAVGLGLWSIGAVRTIDPPEVS